MVADSVGFHSNPVSRSYGHRRTVPTVQVQEIADKIGSRFGAESVSPEAAEILLTLTEDMVRSERKRPDVEWPQLLGPVVKPGLMSHILGISATALAKRRDKAAVLGVQTKSGHWVYPALQLTASERRVVVIPHLQQILPTLLNGADGLAAARWLATPNRRLAGNAPWDVLRQGESQRELESAAGAQSRAWLGT